MPISYLFFLLFFSHLTISSSLDCNADDRTALLNIKSELGNPSEFSTWLPGTNCCTWSNVSCSDNGHIYQIELISLNVSAAIPQSLGDLPELQTIHFEIIPGLYGTIPSSFSKLAKLENLIITNASVSGSIPDSLSRTNLTTLILSNNKLSGPIPLSLTTLSNLQYLDLSGNNLTGTIPPGLVHGRSCFLFLSHNNLTGEIPKDYGDEDMEQIGLSHNRLTGDASFLFGLTKSTDMIDLSWNELKFNLTNCVFSPMLDYLDLSHNRITGKVPLSLQSRKRSYMNLSYNELCGTIPIEKCTNDSLVMCTKDSCPVPESSQASSSRITADLISLFSLFFYLFFS